MLLAAMSPAHRCSCNCPLQHRAVAKQLWQAGCFKGRAATPWNTEQEQTSTTAMMDCQSPLAGTGPSIPCARLQGCGEMKVKSAEQPHTACPSLFFLAAGKSQVYSMHRLHNTHAVTNLFSLQESALGLCQYAENFRYLLLSTKVER